MKKKRKMMKTTTTTTTNQKPTMKKTRMKSRWTSPKETLRWM